MTGQLSVLISLDQNWLLYSLDTASDIHIIWTVYDFEQDAKMFLED